MEKTFGDKLLQIASTIDILDEHTFKDIMNLIEEYTRKTLNIKHVGIMTIPPNSITEDITILNKFGLTNNSSFSITIKNGNGDYCGQMAYSFDNEKPLWIISEKKDLNLIDSDSYIDQWSNCKKLPQYISVDPRSRIRTSIIIPMTKQESKQFVFGVVSFETEEYIEITDQAKIELRNITNTISLLVQSDQIRKLQYKNTSTVIKDLEHEVHKNFIPKLTKPKIFLASPENSEEDVVSIIKEVIDKNFENKVDLIYWKDLNNPGNINEQVIKQIISSRYGICYLSERHSESSTYNYSDNPNVLFEAGLMHAKDKKTITGTSNWIPIREESSPEIPFDFSTERIICIRRNAKGNVNAEKLIHSLKEAMNHLLSE